MPEICILNTGIEHQAGEFHQRGHPTNAWVWLLPWVSEEIVRHQRMNRLSQKLKQETFKLHERDSVLSGHLWVNSMVTCILSQYLKNPRDVWEGGRMSSRLEQRCLGDTVRRRKQWSPLEGNKTTRLHNAANQKIISI